jgi:hypothetical protein
LHRNEGIRKLWVDTLAVDTRKPDGDAGRPSRL